MIRAELTLASRHDGLCQIETAVYVGRICQGQVAQELRVFELCFLGLHMLRAVNLLQRLDQLLG